MPLNQSIVPERSRSRRTGTAVVASVVTLVGVAVGVIWATGGLGTDVKAFQGRQVGLGEVVETRFWDVAVHRAEIVESRGDIRVNVTAVNKQRRTALDLTYRMVEIRLPDGSAMVDSTCTPPQARRFGPLLASDAVCTFSYEGNGVPPDSIPGSGPVTVEFVVRDQELSSDLLQSSEPQAGEPAAWLSLDVTVADEEQQ